MDFTKPKIYPPLPTIKEVDERILQISHKYGKCIPVSCYICGNGHFVPDAFTATQPWLFDACIEYGSMFDDCYICGERLMHGEVVNINLRDFFCHIANFYRNTRFREICVNYVKIRRNGKPFSDNQKHYDFGELTMPLQYVYDYHQRISRDDHTCGIPDYPFNFRRYTYLSAIKIVVKDMIDDGVIESSFDTSWINNGLQEIIEHSC